MSGRLSSAELGSQAPKISDQPRAVNMSARPGWLSLRLGLGAADHDCNIMLRHYKQMPPDDGLSDGQFQVQVPSQWLDSESVAQPEWPRSAAGGLGPGPGRRRRRSAAPNHLRRPCQCRRRQPVTAANPSFPPPGRRVRPVMTRMGPAAFPSRLGHCTSRRPISAARAGPRRPRRPPPARRADSDPPPGPGSAADSLQLESAPGAARGCAAAASGIGGAATAQAGAGH
jgi:hypothetical protein